MKLTDRTTAKTVLPGKITPPEAAWVFARPALLDRLAKLSATVRRIWISSPGGAGKTTLVRAFLASDPRPLVWYQVDVEDRDPANLFFYLSRTVPNGDDGDAPLPQLTPEYLPNLPVFCRNFFRTYFARFPQGCLLVFDDFQEGPGETVQGPVLQAAMAELPANSALFVLSRGEPYASLSRGRVNRTLAHMNWDELRLSRDEAERFIAWSQGTEASPEATDRAYGLTQGWLAGLLLFLENPDAADGPQQVTLERTDLLFDYFAAEIFSRLPGTTREFLLACAFLPTIGTTMAEELTVRREAADILRALVRGNHFTFRISVEPEVYRFHPLFRQFLQARARRELDPQRIAQVQVQAARLLLSDGEHEAAAELLIAAAAWAELTQLLRLHAEALLQQGRTRTLLAWLRALPDAQRNGDPWLCFWVGCCLNAEDPGQARAEFGRAFELFEAADDAVGTMRSCAMGIYAVVVGWNEHAELDVWIARFYRLRARYPVYPSPEIEALMVEAICSALSWRQPSHPDLPVWAARVRELVIASDNRAFRLVAGADLNFYYMLVGDMTAARASRELIADPKVGEPIPLLNLVWSVGRAYCEFMSMESEKSLATVEAGLVLAAESGIHVVDVRLLVTGVAAAMGAGNVSAARRFMDNLRATTVTARFDESFYLFQAADIAALDGELPKAIAMAELAVAKAEAVGAPVALVFPLAVLALALHESSRPEEARRTVARGLTVARGMHYFECYFTLLAGFFTLEDGDTSAAHALLRKGLGFAARNGLDFHPWRDSVMSRLCREALDAGIEADYVRQLAASRSLQLAPCRTARLTPKELDVLALVIAGKTNGEISRVNGVSERTVKFHIGNILQKLHAKSRAHAVSIALELGLIPRN